MLHINLPLKSTISLVISQAEDNPIVQAAKEKFGPEAIVLCGGRVLHNKISPVVGIRADASKFPVLKYMGQGGYLSLKWNNIPQTIPDNHYIVDSFESGSSTYLTLLPIPTMEEN